MSDNRRAYLRHARYYETILRRCNQLYVDGGESWRRGLASFDAAWDNIRAGQAWADAHAEADEEAALLSVTYQNAGPHLLDLRQHPSERARRLEAVLSSVRRLGLRHTEASVLNNLGMAHADLGATPRAVELYEQALSTARALGNRQSEASALGHLGAAYDNLGLARRAIEFCQQALAIARELGDRNSEGTHLGNLGLAHASLGETRRAIELHEQALAITRELGNRLSEESDLVSLGLAYAALGETARAVEYYEQALAVARELGDRSGEASMLGNLANAALDLNEYGRVVGESHERLRYFLLYGTDLPSRPHTLTLRLDTYEYATALTRERDACEDGRVRERLRGAGRALRARVEVIDQPNEGRHPCTLTMVTDQPVRRIRPGTRLKSVDDQVAGVVVEQHDDSGEHRIFFRLSKGVRRGRPLVGQELELVNCIPFDSRRAKRIAYKLMREDGSLFVYHDRLPQNVPRRLPPGSILEAAEGLRRR